MTGRGILGVVALGLVLIGADTLWHSTGSRAAKDPTGGPEVHAPPGTRVRVQVLNGTRTRGLARRATMLLRDRGFDVLENGTDATPRDTTIVYDLTGHPDWAQRVARGLAPARVEARPDSSRYLDVVVVLGATWRPPAQPFYP
ncbi:MAG TPA: LytR C-terminal domain-containing protein [Gemmatimonadaceae bacterium]|nr:LytR C-terminal domain-containing protein [Gemmatimonadaceae bacterium]